MTSWLWAFLAALLSTSYFFLIKQYINSPKILYLFLVVILELVVIYLYYRSLLERQSGIVYSIINGFSVVLGVVIAILFFKEKLELIDILGIGLILAGIIILGEKSKRLVPVIPED